MSYLTDVNVCINTCWTPSLIGFLKFPDLAFKNNFLSCKLCHDMMPTRWFKNTIELFTERLRGENICFEMFSKNILTKRDKNQVSIRFVSFHLNWCKWEKFDLRIKTLPEQSAWLFVNLKKKSRVYFSIFTCRSERRSF